MDQTITWDEMITNYFETKKEFALGTIYGYRARLNGFVEFLTDEENKNIALSKPFQIYNRKDVEEYLKSLKDIERTNSLYNKAYSALLSFGSYLDMIGIESPDIKGLRSSYHEDKEPSVHIFTNQEIYDIANCGTYIENACVRICYEGAIKRENLCDVRVKNFNFEKKQLIVYKPDTTVIDKVCVFSEETMEIIKKAIEEMQMMIDTINKNKIARGDSNLRESDYLFQSKRIPRPSYTGIHNLLKRTMESYCKQNGIVEDEMEEFVAFFNSKAIIASRRVYLLSKISDIKKVMLIMGENNYNVVKSYQKYVPLIYPEYSRIE